MIKAEHLSKRYRSKLAVDDVSFEAHNGKVTGFLGPNGAGKSTTMRLMLGLDSGRGTTTFDGKPLNHYPVPSRVLGMLLEAKAFHPTRSARNHLRILAAAANISDKRVDEVLELVGLSEVAKKGPGKFSLGMSQRLGIAAAVLSNPKYLILDEPANGLDPEGIAWLRQFLKDYADKGNVVFVSSHLLSEMAQMADDVVVIGKGRLIANASMAALLKGNEHASVFIRAEDEPKLKKLLDKNKLSYHSEDGGLVVQGTNVENVGKLAFDNRIQVSELTNRSASLEEVFLELTASAEEYKGQGAK